MHEESLQKHGKILFQKISKCKPFYKNTNFRSNNAVKSTKSKLYDLIQNNVEFRHSAFNNGTFLSLAMAFASMTAGASAIKWVDQWLIIWASITIFWLWMAQWARATANVIEAYKRKVGIEFEQLLAVEEMLALLGSLVTPMYNEEWNYEFAQKTRWISASDAQKNNITWQRLWWSIAAWLWMVMVLVYLSKYVPTGDNESLYDMVKSIFWQ